MITRQDLLTRIRQVSDTLNNTVDYPDALIKDLASMVHLDEWKKILGEAPYYRTRTATVSVDDQRTFAWSLLNGGSGDTLQTAFRILEMTDSYGRNLTYVQPDQVRLADLTRILTTHRMWTKVGDSVQTFGTISVSTSLTVLVNYLPTTVGDLSADNVTVDFPSPYEPILYYETAAILLAKGGREIGESQALKGLAEDMRQRFLHEIRRESASAMLLLPNDLPWEWGG